MRAFDDSPVLGDYVTCWRLVVQDAAHQQNNGPRGAYYNTVYPA